MDENTDQRLARLREVIAAMRAGVYGVAVDVAGDDEVGRLGQAMRDLAAALDKRFNELQTAARVTEQINAGLLLDDVMTQIFSSFRSVFPFERLGVALLSEDGSRLVHRWSKSLVSPVKIGPGYEAPLRGSSLHTLIRSGTPRIINDLCAHLDAHPESHSTRLIVAEGMRSSLTCPLIAFGRPIGCMFFSSTHADTYRDAHIETYSLIAGSVSVIVEKARLYQQLVDLNAFRDNVLGMAAHDLRGPLAVFSATTELMLGEYLGPLTDRQRNALRQMDRNTQRMLSLLTDLLDVHAVASSRLTLSLEPTDLATVIAERWADDGVLASSKRITLVSQVPASLPAVSADRRRVHQVLDNLISNAVKYAEPGTTVTVAAHAHDEGVTVAVTDQGPGIPPEEMGRLFHDYARTRNQPTGGEASTGLGLAIVKRLVDAHGGHVAVESTPGVGSTFRFTLPILAIGAGLPSR